MGGPRNDEVLPIKFTWVKFYQPWMRGILPYSLPKIFIGGNSSNLALSHSLFIKILPTDLSWSPYGLLLQL